MFDQTLTMQAPTEPMKPPSTVRPADWRAVRPAVQEGFIETSRQVQVRARGLGHSVQWRSRSSQAAGLRVLHDGRGDFEDVVMDVHYAPSLASNARLRSTPQR
jgi:hypothetical protein